MNSDPIRVLPRPVARARFRAEDRAMRALQLAPHVAIMVVPCACAIMAPELPQPDHPIWFPVMVHFDQSMRSHRAYADTLLDELDNLHRKRERGSV